MWLFTQNSFLSVVQHRTQQHNVLVRARVKEHIIRLFPKAVKQIQRNDEADYRWRLLVSKQDLAEVVSAYILQNLDYDNFKDSQEADDPAWMRFLHEVWAEGLKLQKLPPAQTHQGKKTGVFC